MAKRASTSFGQGYKPEALKGDDLFKIAASIFALSPPLLSLPQPDAPPPVRQCRSWPHNKLIGFVKQPLWHAPKGQVYGAAILLVVERRIGRGLLEDRSVVVINPGVVQ